MAVFLGFLVLLNVTYNNFFEPSCLLNSTHISTTLTEKIIKDTVLYIIENSKQIKEFHNAHTQNFNETLNITPNLK